MTHATKVGRLSGRNVFRVPVTVRHNDSRSCRTVAERTFTVLAFSAADAARWAIEHETGGLPETEVHAIGPKGGRVSRFIGWEAAIARELFGTRRAPTQLAFTGHDFA